MSTNANYQRSETEQINFVINATSNANITGKGSRARFTILPAPNTLLTISFFNLSGDVIDFSAFPKLHTADDLSIKKGSVLISLEKHQTVKLMNVNPTDMRAEHFDFAPYNAKHDSSTADSTVMYVVVPAGLMVLAYLAYKIYLWRQEKAAVNRTVKQVKERLQLQAEAINLKRGEQFKALSKLHFDRQERLLVVVFDEKLLSVTDYPNIAGQEVEEEQSEGSRATNSETAVVEIIEEEEEENVGDGHNVSYHSSDLNSLMDSDLGSVESDWHSSPAASPRNSRKSSGDARQQQFLHQPGATPGQLASQLTLNAALREDVHSVSSSHSSGNSSAVGSSSSGINSGGSSEDKHDEDDDLRSVMSAEDWV